MADLTSIERIRAAGAFMKPGGGSLETNDAVQALHLICLSQQEEIDELRSAVQNLKTQARVAANAQRLGF